MGDHAARRRKALQSKCVGKPRNEAVTKKRDAHMLVHLRLEFGMQGTDKNVRHTRGGQCVKKIRI